MYIDRLALGIVIGCIAEFAVLIVLATWHNTKK